MHHPHEGSVRNAQLLLAKQAATFASTSLNALSRWHIVSSGHSIILGVDPVTPVNIDYLPAEYCLAKDLPSLILNRDNWNPNTVILPELLDIYTDGSKLDNGVGSTTTWT